MEYYKMQIACPHSFSETRARDLFKASDL